METIKIPTASLLLWPGNFLATSLSLLAMTLSCRCIKKYFPKVYFLTYWVTCKGSWFRHQEGSKLAHLELIFDTFPLQYPSTVGQEITWPTLPAGGDATTQ